MGKSKDRYAKIGGRFWRHPKVIGLSDSAGWLWTRALSYQPDQLTDGSVPLALLKTLGHHTIDAAEELVSAGLWERVRGGGYRFHDYEDHNTTSSEWETEKARKAKNKADSRSAQAADVTGDMCGDKPSAGVTRSPAQNQALSDAGRRTQDAGHFPDLNQRADLDQIARARDAFGDDLGPEIARLQAHVRAALKPKGANPSDLTSSKWTDIARWCREMATTEMLVDDVQCRLAAGFAADSGRAAKAGYPISYLAKNPSEFFGKHEARTGYVRPDSVQHEATSDDDFERALRGGAR